MKKDILVIGDSCRDIFVYCDVSRLCPDVPVPVLNVVNQVENGGMAKNVQRNIEKFASCDIITNKDWHNNTKTRYVHEKTNHTFVRVDSNDRTIQQINLSEIDYSYKIIVISDYDKGFLSTKDIQTICKNHNSVFVDTKKTLGDWVNGARFIKINDVEYEKSKHHITSAIKDRIIHTKGGDGCVFQQRHYPVHAVEVKDVSGAGDTFLAGLVVKYLQTDDICESIKYANACASEVVKHRGVTLL